VIQGFAGLNKLRLGLLHQPERGGMQFAKLRFAGFILCEFDEVATLEKPSQTVLLPGQ
jgi:hypothetical protein